MTTITDNLANGVHNAGNRLEAGMQRRASQLATFFDDVEELLRRVSTLEDAGIKRLRTRVESSIEHAREATNEGMNRAVAGTRKAARATDDYVRTNPWKVIGLTAAGGFLLGALLRRK
jgi:ElaB/YqjD/DUF883 family membrane-anchored ribosome-binding protein